MIAGAIMLIVYASLAVYIERRTVTELALPPMARELGLGLFVGFGLYTVCVLILMGLGNYRIVGLQEWHMLLAGLASILDACAGQLAPSSSGTRQMFRKLADVELESFGLRPEWPPDAGDQHYAQVRDPLPEPGARASQTVLILSAGRPGPSARLYFTIAHFPRHALEKPDFDVLDDALARIRLDRDSTRALARLLQAQLEGMAE